MNWNAVAELLFLLTKTGVILYFGPWQVRLAWALWEAYGLLKTALIRTRRREIQRAMLAEYQKQIAAGAEAEQAVKSATAAAIEMVRTGKGAN